MESYANIFCYVLVLVYALRNKHIDIYLGVVAFKIGRMVVVFIDSDFLFFAGVRLLHVSDKRPTIPVVCLVYFNFSILVR